FAGIRARHGSGAQCLQAAVEAVGLLGLPHLLVHREARARYMEKRVLFRAVQGHVIVAALTGVHEFDIDVVADAFNVAVMPDLEGESGSFTATLVHRALVSTPGRVRVDAVRLAVGDVDVTAIGLPSRLSGGEMLVRIGDPT